MLDGTSYLERVAVNKPAGVVKTKKAIRKAFQRQLDGAGFSLVEILSPCPTAWKMGTLEACTWVDEVMSKVFPLGVVKDVTSAPHRGASAPRRRDAPKDLFSGFGGQGVLSMGTTLATAAMLEGKYVTYFPAYGVEVRGGTANCTVVVSDEEIASPVASDPEFVVAMNQPSFARFQSILQPGGLLCVNSSIVNTETARSDIEILAIPTSELAEGLGTIKVANMVMLGALVRASNMISYDADAGEPHRDPRRGQGQAAQAQPGSAGSGLQLQQRSDRVVIKQLSVSLDNVPGTLATISESLGREGVNVRAISVADTSDRSTVRFVFDDPEKAKNMLIANGYTPRRPRCWPSRYPTTRGACCGVLKPLKAAGINVHYLYPHLGRVSNNAIVILGVDKTEEAQKVLAANWVKTLGREAYNVVSARPAGRRRRRLPGPVVGSPGHLTREARVPEKSFAGTSHTAVYALLGLGSVMCVALVAGRGLYSHTHHFQTLVWNLFLAWIPLVLSALIYRASTRRGEVTRWILVPVAIVWLLFFPNAPYIVTDLVHLGQYQDNVPSWYDVMLVAWFAWTGLLLGVVSLRLMQEIVERARGSRAGWAFVFFVTAAGSVGIYVGRFLRFNSWNVFQAPLTLADTGWDQVNRPDAGELLLGFSILFGLLFLFVYCTISLLARPGRRPS